MYLKLDEIYDGKIANQYAAKFIKGTNLQKNEDWEKAIFANQKELVQKLYEFSPGDDINIVMEQKGKHWNIVDILPMSDADYARLDSATAKYGKGGNGGAPKGEAETKAPAAKSTWNGRTGEAYDRSAAIYLAKDVLAMVDAKFKTVEEAIASLCEAAEPIYNYIHDGAALAMPAKKGRKSKKVAEEDALEPPEID